MRRFLFGIINNMPEKKEFEWSAPEFEYHPKAVSWYWILAIGAIVLITIALLQKNFLFAIFLLIALILVLKLGHQHPRYLDFHLNDRGLTINNEKLHPYDSMDGFAVQKIDHDDNGLSEVIFRRKHRLGTFLKVLIPTKHIEEVRIFLNNYLPEIEYEESLTDHISRLLKF